MEEKEEGEEGREEVVGGGEEEGEGRGEGGTREERIFVFISPAVRTTRL